MKVIKRKPWQRKFIEPWKRWKEKASPDNIKSRKGGEGSGEGAGKDGGHGE